jgi:hypothetical protein
MMREHVQMAYVNLKTVPPDYKVAQHPTHSGPVHAQGSKYIQV